MALDKSKTPNQIDRAFPFPDYRPLYEGKTQKDVIQAILLAFQNGNDTVFLDAPVGIGKTAINATVCNLSESAFYTTPQKSLRNQIEADEHLKSAVETLQAREDYTCDMTQQNCRDCRINRNRRQSCLDVSDCTYWDAKERAMDSHTAVITFAYMLIDSAMPSEVGGTRISFSDRELLVVDETQDLVSQVAGLHAGIHVHPEKIPDQIYYQVSSLIPPQNEAKTHKDVLDVIDELSTVTDNFIKQEQSKKQTPKRSVDLQEAKNLQSKVDWLVEDIDQEKNTWVVDIEENYKDSSRNMKLRPVSVVGYLWRNLWNRTDKRILSTATLPYHKNPNKYCYQLGLDPEKATRIKVDMPFPLKNRPIHTSSMIGQMKNGGTDRNWSAIVSEIDRLAGEHEGEKGLIHSVSYKRAQKLMNSINPADTPNLYENILRQNRRYGAEEMIGIWQDSLEDVLVSPSMQQGVDLYDDRCRWQVLVKCPNPDTSDSRWKYLLDNEPYGWEAYWQQSMNNVIQAYGRGVRHKNDYCDFYPLDTGLNKLVDRTKPPGWFQEAFV